jgi:GTPase SAR1 family protein
MLRQIHIFVGEDCVYNHTYALALAEDELNNVTKIIQSYIEMPIPGKIFHRPVSEHFQIFHKSEGNVLFLFITDLVDSLDYIGPMIDNTTKKLKELFPNPRDLKDSSENKREFVDFLREQQYKLHSKITIIGPTHSGKTLLYAMLKSGDERAIMNFARASVYMVDNLKFDIWDFALNDNFSLMWSKFIKGSDLVILLFDLSNYHLRVIDHFLNLQKQESKFSKLLILGNKRDLVEDEDIKLIKNELDIPHFEEISLIEANTKEKIKSLIAKMLSLKKLLPHYFTELLNEAKNLEREGNLILAISKYKELIKICNNYQDFTYINELKKNLDHLQKKVEEQAELRKKADMKMKFEIPGKIQFSRSIKVQPLPSRKSDVKAPPSTEVPKTTYGAQTSQKMEKKAGDLMLFSKSDSTVETDEAELDKEDITLDINLVIPEEKRPILEERKIGEELSSTLQRMIEKKGSSLSLKLCLQLITELQKSLARPLKMEDVEFAAEVFVKHDLS